MAATTLIIEPTRESPGKTKTYRALSTNFGDGYKEALADGINTKEEKWDLTWSNVSNTDGDALVAFFDVVESHTAFFWTAPGESQKLWLAGPLKSKPITGSTDTLSITIERFFGPEP